MRRKRNNVEPVEPKKFIGDFIRGTRHPGKRTIQAKEVPVGDRRGCPVFRSRLDSLRELKRLVKPLDVLAIHKQMSGKLVNKAHFSVADYVRSEERRVGKEG